VQHTFDAFKNSSQLMGKHCGAAIRNIEEMGE